MFISTTCCRRVARLDRPALTAVSKSSAVTRARSSSGEFGAQATTEDVAVMRQPPEEGRGTALTTSCHLNTCDRGAQEAPVDRHIPSRGGLPAHPALHDEV